MKKIFYSVLFVFAGGCNSGTSTNNDVDTATTNAVKGNSGGSSIIEMDTMRMDTSGGAILSDTNRR